MEVEIQEIKQLLKELVLSQKETDIKFKETDKRIKAAFDLFEGQWGKLRESLVEGDLIKLLQAKGINVHDTSMRRKGVYEGNNYEFDIIAHNGTEIVIVEVKTTLKTQDVKAFVQKLKQVRVWLDEYKNYTVYGAIAFLRADSGSEMFAQSEKLFVIKATGNSAMIIKSDDFVPQKF